MCIIYWADHPDCTHADLLGAQLCGHLGCPGTADSTLRFQLEDSQADCNSCLRESGIELNLGEVPVNYHPPTEDFNIEFIGAEGMWYDRVVKVPAKATPVMEEENEKMEEVEQEEDQHSVYLSDVDSITSHWRLDATDDRENVAPCPSPFASPTPHQKHRPEPKGQPPRDKLQDADDYSLNTAHHRSLVTDQLAHLPKYMAHHRPPQPQPDFCVTRPAQHHKPFPFAGGPVLGGPWPYGCPHKGPAVVGHVPVDTTMPMLRGRRLVAEQLRSLCGKAVASALAVATVNDTFSPHLPASPDTNTDMESLPQRPVSQRRPSPPAESSSPQQGSAERTNSVSGQSVEDSQTLLLNSPPRQSVTQEQEAATQHSAAQEEEDARQEEDDEPRKCWICFQDETEDDETTSEWRSPCACSLVAHEKCLLDWIADMEAPSSRRRAGQAAGTILCPQCKSEVVVERPRSYMVDGVRALERAMGNLLLPSVALVTATALYSTLTLSGTHTIYQIFGTEDALQILGPLYETPNPMVGSVAIRLLQHLRQHWRLDLGLPLIPTVLVASRTTTADSFLPFLPLIFFVSSGQPGDELLQLQWPPSAAFSFAALPYLRGFYNAYYERVWAPWEQQWLKEIQPRAGEDPNSEAPVQIVDEHAHDDDGADEVVEQVEIELDFDIFADWNNPPDPVAQGAAGPIDAPPQDDDDMPQHAAPAPNVPVQPVAPRPRRVRRERNIAFSSSSLADTVLGALIFPSIAAAMGELLKHTLPTSWVSPPVASPATSWLGGWVNTGGGGKGRPNGFLQTRWGRSIVGGCLFVGLKDAVMLYVRWKVAQNHRRRRVLDVADANRRRGMGEVKTSPQMRTITQV
ncbi:hypothetical protein EJ02DRAFT_511503 [Clathrospora elynae]|uniref:RING-CH-type domain-containing protein n=1 Tax=Clathrospora elynae TaxID=706981 RepID=A0A6A5SSF6_9PLEO|nr:hypothetical protein EJ02DRAFT_511503 [Clathrospora elynae]